MSTVVIVATFRLPNGRTSVDFRQLRDGQPTGPAMTDEVPSTLCPSIPSAGDQLAMTGQARLVAPSML